MRRPVIFNRSPVTRSRGAFMGDFLGISLVDPYLAWPRRPWYFNNPGALYRATEFVASAGNPGWTRRA